MEFTEDEARELVAAIVGVATLQEGRRFLLTVEREGQEAVTGGVVEGSTPGCGLSRTTRPTSESMYPGPRLCASASQRTSASVPGEPWDALGRRQSAKCAYGPRQAPPVARQP
jgi:hypothetical protein